MGTCATVPIGHLGKPLDTFWQLFFRPSGGATWSNQVEATATATNGASCSPQRASRSSSGSALPTICASARSSPPPTAARPGPTACSDEGRAAHPDALALGTAGHALAVSDGLSGDEVLASAGSLSKWRELLTLGALRCTKAGKACAPRAITAVGYTDSAPTVGVSCSKPGAVGVFLYHGGAWLTVAPQLPSSVVHGTVAVLGMGSEVSGMAVVLGVAASQGKSLIVSWTPSPSSWRASPPLQLTRGENLVSFGPTTGPTCSCCWARRGVPNASISPAARRRPGAGCRRRHPTRPRWQPVPPAASTRSASTTLCSPSGRSPRPRRPGPSLKRFTYPCSSGRRARDHPPGSARLSDDAHPLPIGREDGGRRHNWARGASWAHCHNKGGDRQRPPPTRALGRPLRSFIPSLATAFAPGRARTALARAAQHGCPGPGEAIATAPLVTAP